MQTGENIDVKNLSDRKLWEILRAAETKDMRIASVVVAHARQELSARHQHTEARRFRAPR